ncbi:hypothetical protein AGMMS49921_01850 [Endomicrobiia bacterium]|nr:hypothetical protein AGMMS49921_01850 [Endomicrobiia bacterium]
MGSNYDKFETVCRILEENKVDNAKLVPILQAIQKNKNIYRKKF